MRLIIEARLVDGDSDMVVDGDEVLAVVERPDCSLAELGLTLAEGRSLLAKVQAHETLIDIVVYQQPVRTHRGLPGVSKSCVDGSFDGCGANSDQRIG